MFDMFDGLIWIDALMALLDSGWVDHQLPFNVDARSGVSQKVTSNWAPCTRITNISTHWLTFIMINICDTSYPILPLYKWGDPQIIHVHRLFHHKPSILGHLHFMEPQWIFASLQTPAAPEQLYDWMPHSVNSAYVHMKTHVPLHVWERKRAKDGVFANC